MTEPKADLLGPPARLGVDKERAEAAGHVRINSETGESYGHYDGGKLKRELILRSAAQSLADALEKAAERFTALAKYTDERKSPKDTAILIQWRDDARAALRGAGRITEDAAEPQKSIP